MPEQMTTSPPRPAPYGHVMAMAAIVMAVLLSVLDYAVANIALPTITRELGASPSAGVWVVNAYQLAGCALMLPLATWSEKIGAVKLCQIGLVILMAGSVLCAWAPNLPVMAVARMTQGVGGACIMAVYAALVRAVCPPQRIGQGLAMTALATSLGVALSPSVAALILMLGSWRWLFLFNLPCGLITLAFVLKCLPPIQGQPRRMDGLAIGLNIVTFTAFLIGADMLAHGEAAGIGAGLVLAGVVAMGVLVMHQKNMATPMLPLDLLGIPAFRTGFVTCFLAYVAANFYMISIPFTLNGLFHRSAIETGLLIMPWPGSMVLMAPVVGRLADRYSAGCLVSIGLFMTGVGFLLVRLLPPDAGNLNIMWRFAVAGMGYSLFTSPNNRSMVVASPASRSSSASGMISISRILGQTFGAIGVAFILARVRVNPALHCLEWATATAWVAALISASRLRRPQAGRMVSS